MLKDSSNLIRDCADDLTLTISELMSIVKTAPRRYFVWQIDKRSGSGKRTVCHPARELKAVQYYFLNKVLYNLPVHPRATAYASGSSIKKNAEAHVGSRVVMKLDFSDFFNSLKVSNWTRYASDHFPKWSYDEIDFSCRVLFWGAGTYSPKCLAIGSPTSPLLSNALMYEVDVALANYAESRNLKYTRYADDITFSSQHWLDYEDALATVKSVLLAAQNTSISINNSKTVLVSKKCARRITGLMVTPDNKISLGRSRKRLISAMIHRACCKTLSAEDHAKLAGLLAFAADVEPEFIWRLQRKYSVELLQQISRNDA